MGHPDASVRCCSDKRVSEDILESSPIPVLLVLQRGGADADAPSNIAGLRQKPGELRRPGECASPRVGDIDGAGYAAWLTAPTLSGCALRTSGATRVPSSSILCSIFSCASRTFVIWNVSREIPPKASDTDRTFSATVSGLPMNSAPVGPRWASKLDRLGGAKPRSLPIAPNISA